MDKTNETSEEIVKSIENEATKAAESVEAAVEAKALTEGLEANQSEASALDTQASDVQEAGNTEEPVKYLTEKERLKAEKKAKKAAKKAAKREKEANKSLLQNIFETVAFACIALAIALLIKNYIGQPIYVDGTSMNTTFNDGEWVWANKLNYTPKRYDVIIFKNDHTKGQYFIKRIIGMPGDTVFIDSSDNSIYINDEKIDDPYGYFKEGSSSPYGDRTFVLGADSYIVLGDNRYASRDSRDFGAIKGSDIKGHVVARIWPLNKIGDFDK